MRNRYSFVGGLVLAAVLIVPSRPVWAVDSKLDSAQDNIARTITLLKAADGPGYREYKNHVQSAIQALETAQEDVRKAKRIADRKAAEEARKVERRAENEVKKAENEAKKKAEDEVKKAENEVKRAENDAKRAEDEARKGKKGI